MGRDRRCGSDDSCPEDDLQVKLEKTLPRQARGVERRELALLLGFGGGSATEEIEPLTEALAFQVNRDGHIRMGGEAAFPAWGEDAR